MSSPDNPLEFDVTTQNDKARLFHSLHVRGQPLVLFNAWDAGSARAVAEAGAGAVATGSWSVAAANGFADGERMPFPFALDNLRRIIAAVTQPVTIDLESGYGERLHTSPPPPRSMLAPSVAT
jgi:methylisocitrate lyase